MKTFPDLLTKKSLEHYLSEGIPGRVRAEGDATSIVLANNTTDFVEIGNQKFYPDETKGYILCKLSFGFPVFNQMQQGMHPQVIANSHQTMLHQNVNLEHVMVAYDPEAHRQDKVVGSVIAVEFPRTPPGGWKIDRDPAKAPYVLAAASFTKLARGMDTIIGKHLSGKQTYSVSMEAGFAFADSGFAVRLNEGQKPKFDTPRDFLEAGWEYVPITDAPDELLLCFSVKKKMITSDYKGRTVVQLIGGLNGNIHYAGFAIVARQAEKPAEILQMAASAKDPAMDEFLSPLKKLANLLGQK